MISESWCSRSLALITASDICFDIPNKVRPPITGRPDPVGSCCGSEVSAGRSGV